MFVVRTLTFLSEQLSKCLYTQSDKIKIDCVNKRGKNRALAPKTPLFTLQLTELSEFSFTPDSAFL